MDDILRGSNGRMKTCADVMTKDPTCCLVTDPVSTAAQVMKREDVGSVPVVSDDEQRRLMGVVTDRDIVVRVLADGKDANGIMLNDVMSADPVTCHPEDPLQDAFDCMAEHQVRRLPIVDGENRVIGIISQADVATRVDKPKRTAALLEEISQPVS